MSRRGSSINPVPRGIDEEILKAHRSAGILPVISDKRCVRLTEGALKGTVPIGEAAAGGDGVPAPWLAEREGFEPSEHLLDVHAISSRAPSAARASLQSSVNQW